MRILTVRQPWAWAIIHGGKDVENRSTNVAGGYRGPVAIHAAIGKTAALNERQERLLLAADEDGRGGIGAWLDGEPIAGGVILGVVDLVDVHLSKPSTSNTHAGKPVCFDHYTRIGHVCSPWAQEFPAPGGFHMVLSNPRPLAEPIPYKGALGLRRLDPETILAITRQIGRTA